MEGMSLEARVAAISERLGAVNAAAEKAHSRIDEVNILIRADLKEAINDLKVLTAWMNHKKGWEAAMMLVSGAIGGTVATIITIIFGK